MTLEEAHKLLIDIVLDLRPRSHHQGVLGAALGAGLASRGHRRLHESFGFGKLTDFLRRSVSAATRLAWRFQAFSMSSLTSGRRTTAAPGTLLYDLPRNATSLSLGCGRRIITEQEVVPEIEQVVVYESKELGLVGKFVGALRRYGGWY